MSYAVARTKLANLLIKAGYDKTKSLKAVKYPYVEILQFVHNHRANGVSYWDYDTESIIEYENGGNFVKLIQDYQIPFSNEFPNDKSYKILGDISEAKVHLDVKQNSVDWWLAYYGYGVPWWSQPLTIRAKYRHRYPTNEIKDSRRDIGTGYGGNATSGGEYGHHKGTMPLPEGGWEKIELPD